MIISCVYNADVLLRGRRREIRRQYRLDVPIEFARVSRKDLVPAIEIRFDRPGKSKRPVVISSCAGRLWRPHVPVERREVRGVEDLPGPYAEQHAMTEAEFAALAGGAAEYNGRGVTHDDPLKRERGSFLVERNAWTPASAMRLLEDDDIRSVLWSDRPKTEARLRTAAEGILIVDGMVWTQQSEPVLELFADDANGRREVRIAFDERSWHSIRHFRLDRLDDIVDWAARQGSSVVPVKNGLQDAAVHLRDGCRMVGDWTPKRDDARVVLAGRLYAVLHEGAPLVSLLPSSAVDALVSLKLFWQRPAECACSTPELYGHLRTIAAAIEALSGLSDEEFGARRRMRTAISPLLVRWHSHEEARYAPAEAPAP